MPLLSGAHYSDEIPHSGGLLIPQIQFVCVWHVSTAGLPRAKSSSLANRDARRAEPRWDKGIVIGAPKTGAEISDGPNTAIHGWSALVMR